MDSRGTIFKVAVPTDFKIRIGLGDTAQKNGTVIMLIGFTRPPRYPIFQIVAAGKPGYDYAESLIDILNDTITLESSSILWEDVLETNEFVIPRNDHPMLEAQAIGRGRREREPLMQRDEENEKVLDDLNEFMMAAKYHMLMAKTRELDHRFPRPTKQEIDALMNRIFTAVRKHDKPAVKY